jgi:hypothetical protein
LPDQQQALFVGAGNSCNVSNPNDEGTSRMRALKKKAHPISFSTDERAMSFPFPY